MIIDELHYIPIEQATLQTSCCVNIRYKIAGLMARHFRRSCSKIMSLAFSYIINAILIRYGILYIDIIIFKTPYIKFNMFNIKF